MIFGIASTHWSLVYYHSTGTVATRNTFFLFNKELSAPADPEISLLQKPNCQDTTGVIRQSLPTQRAALDMPGYMFFIHFETDGMVGELVEQTHKRFTPDL